MLTTIVLGNTAYSSNGTAYSGFVGTTKSWAQGRIYGLRLTLDDENYAACEFTVLGCSNALPFVPGLPISLFTSANDGTSPILRFAGDLQRPEMRPSTHGPAWGYSANDLKRRADYVTLLNGNGTGVAAYNLSPSDPLYLFNLAGQTVGQIITNVLTSSINAASLTGLGVGNMTLAGSTYTLPAQTVTDLSLLTIVPPRPVQLSGEGILNVIESFLQQWHPQYTLYVQPDGTIRVISIFGRTAYTFTLPSGSSAAGDPVDALTYTGPDLSGCYTAVQVVGTDIAGAVLSFKDGTLTRGGTAADLAAWTSDDFQTSTNAADDGTITATTSTSCTVHSNHATVHWVANYWNGIGGVIVFYNLSIAGLGASDFRQITSCTALTAGGTASITWDSSLPLDTTAYNGYRIYATNTPRNLVDRQFLVTDPSTHATGLSTYIGSHMYPTFPFGFPFGNIGKGSTAVSTVNFPAASVLWSPTGAWPWRELPVNLDLDPKNGAIILKLPAVFLSAALAGASAGLANGYPTTYAQGKFVDVNVVIPYNRGSLNARSPATSYSGTAFTNYGLQRVKVIALGTYNWKGNTASLTLLAHEILMTLQDAVTTGSIKIHYDAWTPTFDPLVLGYALNIVTPAGASPIDGLNLPVRSVTMEWPEEGPDVHLVTFGFSNRHRAFEGDDLYIHPSFAATGWGQDLNYTVFIAGNIGGMEGTVTPKELAYGQAMQAQAQAQTRAQAGYSGGDNTSVGGMDASSSMNVGRSPKARESNSPAAQRQKAIDERRANRKDAEQSMIDENKDARVQQAQADDPQRLIDQRKAGRKDTEQSTIDENKQARADQQAKDNKSLRARRGDRDLNRTGPPSKYAGDPLPEEGGPFDNATNSGGGIGGTEDPTEEGGT